MKLATFTTEGSKDPRYGFKKEKYWNNFSVVLFNS